MVRTFTLEEASALLPRIVPLVARMSRTWVSLHRIARSLGVDAARLGDLEHEELTPDQRDALGRGLLLIELLQADAAALDALGAVPDETHRSIVGFRSVVDGERDVLLCFQLGEREIRFFREVGASFDGRQPVEGHRFFKSRQLRAPSE